MKKLLSIFALLALSACSIVGPGQKGVRVSFGKTSDVALDSGVYLWLPFAYGMEKLDVQVQKSETENSADSEE